MEQSGCVCVRWVLTCNKYKEVHWDIPWTIKDDSALLRGIHEHGLGNWDAIKMDSKLNLTDKILPRATKQLQTRAEYLLKLIRRQYDSSKLTSTPMGGTMPDLAKKNRKPLRKRVKKEKVSKSKAIVENDDDSNESDSKTFPVLLQLNVFSWCCQKAGSKKKVKAEDGKSNQNADKPGTSQQPADSKKPKKKKSTKEKAAKKAQPVMHFTANAEPKVIGQQQQEIDEATFLQVLDRSLPTAWDGQLAGWGVQCKEKMRPMKKALKELDNPDPSLTNDDQVKIARQCLIKIGDHINECLKEYQNDPNLVQEWRCHLWIFVSWFTEFDAKKLYKLYRHAIRKEENGPRGNGHQPGGSGGPPGPSKPKKNHNSEEHGSRKRPPSTEPSNSSSSKRPHYDNNNKEEEYYHQGPHHNNQYNNPPFNSQYHGGYSGNYGAAASYHGGDSWRRKPDNYRPPPYNNNSNNNNNNNNNP
ncbi:CHD1 [Cordylochernes scorpioides]|uniref:CHD1 n=1 Tax=Cordylochernes scorpioides TaxID=51811 RepID=A0ABY6KKE9_9ARAC|nr:CHD1 [Cordylochernes scorpioides]